MKVCFLNDSFPPLFDGVINVVLNYAEIFSEKYGESMIVTPYYPHEEEHHYPYPVVQYPSLHVRWIKDYRVGNMFSRRAAKMVREFHPDVIHCHSPAASLLFALRLRKKIHAPIVLTYHTKFDIDAKRTIVIPFLRRPLMKAMVAAIEKCDDVWCVSEGAAENLRSLGYQGDLRIMKNGVDFPKGPASEEEADLIRQEYHLTKEIPTFLFVGRMLWYKGIDLILPALEALQKDGKDFRMVFVGDGDDFCAIRERTQQLGISEKCIFTGAVSDRDQLRRIYSAADLFLLLSTYDTFSLTVREALSCGCPSILLNGSSAAAGFEDEKTAFLVESSADDLFRKLKEVAYDPELLKDVGNNAMNEMWFSWEDAVKQAYERYQELLDTKN